MPGSVRRFVLVLTPVVLVVVMSLFLRFYSGDDSGEAFIASREGATSVGDSVLEPSEIDESIEVRLTINGIRHEDGMLRIAVFNSASGFPDHSQALQRHSVAPDGGTDSHSLTLALPETGEFAVAVYHDVDANQQLNRAALGYPTEPYGFSADARSTFGPPGWKAAAVSIEQSGASLSLTLR